MKDRASPNARRGSIRPGRVAGHPKDLPSPRGSGVLQWRTCGRTLAVVVTAGVLIASCGSSSADREASPATSDAGSTAVSDAASTNVTTTTLPGGPCGVVDADLVTQVLGQPATLVSTELNQCGFDAGTWRLQVSAGTYEPEDGFATSPTGPGVSVPLSVLVLNDRGGGWTARGGFSIDGVSYSIFLINGARGSDTYPPADGPAQKPITAEAGTALLNAIAASDG